MINAINPAWHGTLEFLAGMVSPEQAEEVVQEASQSYFEGKISDTINSGALGDIDLAYRIMSDQNLSRKKKLSRLLDEVPHLMNKNYFRAFSEKTQNFMLNYTSKTIPALKKSKWKARLTIPLLLLSAGLGSEIWWYSYNSSKEREISPMEVKPLLPSEKENYFEQKAELLREGKKECEEISFSHDLIRCYRYYTFNKAGKIVEEGYKEGFRPVHATSRPDNLGNTVNKRLVWKLTPKECFTVHHGGWEKVILELDYNHYWEWEYNSEQEAYDAAQTLEMFCKKRADNLTEQDYSEVKIPPPFKKLSRWLAEGREDCDRISYSPQAIECLKVYFRDFEGHVLEDEHEENLDLSFANDLSEDSWKDELRLVWRINSKECQKVYDAGAGVVIMELEGGRVWEFKHYGLYLYRDKYPKKAVGAEEKEKWYQAYLNMEKETPEPQVSEAEMIATELQDFCTGGDDDKNN